MHGETELKARASGYSVEIRVEGLVSDLARWQLTPSGWVVNDQGFRRLGQ